MIAVAQEISRTAELLLTENSKGRGVFSAEFIQQGDYILEFRGELYSRDEYLSSVNRYNNHFLQIDEKLYLGPSETLDNYINHSCNPNCGIKYVGNLVFLCAIRDIPKGEELTFDYSTTMDEDFWEMDCLCGENNCRHTIRDFKYLPVQLQMKYISMGIVPDFILRTLFK